MVRQVLQDDDFSLPYWNAASEDLADQSLPAEFREKGSPLYNPTRFPWVQAGEPLKMLFGNWVSLNALNETFYIDKLNGNLGFCPQVDINPHALTHMSVGGDLSLGFIRVVQDPIFWPHHANIDRVWESWSRLGHQNPTDPKWLDRKFTFADRKGKRVDVPVSAVNRSPTRYEYYVRTAPKACSRAAETGLQQPLARLRPSSASLTSDRGDRLPRLDPSDGYAIPSRSVVQGRSVVGLY